MQPLKDRPLLAGARRELARARAHRGLVCVPLLSVELLRQRRAPSRLVFWRAVRGARVEAVRRAQRVRPSTRRLRPQLALRLREWNGSGRAGTGGECVGGTRRGSVDGKVGRGGTRTSCCIASLSFSSFSILTWSSIRRRSTTGMSRRSWRLAGEICGEKRCCDDSSRSSSSLTRRRRSSCIWRRASPSWYRNSP
jgi:hypothetical protein